MTFNFARSIERAKTAQEMCDCSCHNTHDDCDDCYYGCLSDPVEEYTEKTTIFRDGTKRVINENSFSRKESWYYGNNLYRKNDLPALTTYLQDEKWMEEWYDNGKLNRFGDRPTKVEYKNGKVICQQWHVDGLKNRIDDRPTIVKYDEKGNKIYEAWHRNDEKYRDNGSKPVEITYNNGRVVSETFHHCNDVQEIVYDESGNKKWQCWSAKNGAKKRESKDGVILPLNIVYYDSGDVQAEEFYRDGIYLYTREYEGRGKKTDYSFYKYTSKDYPAFIEFWNSKDCEKAVWFKE